MVSGTVSVLLAKTLASSTFKLALISIGTFGVIVSAIFSYVYLSTSAYVRSRSDRAIVTEYLSLKSAYERSGRDGLIALIQERIADSSFADNVYILADPSSVTLAGWGAKAPYAAGIAISTGHDEAGVALMAAAANGPAPATLVIPDANAAAMANLRRWGFRAANAGERMRLGPPVAWRPERQFGLFNLFWG